MVKHLAPDDFDSNSGLSKLLVVLRKLPIPDSFSKLECWHLFRHKENESFPELIVREDDLFRDLQASLFRSRAREKKVVSPERRATGSMPEDRSRPTERDSYTRGGRFLAGASLAGPWSKGPWLL